MLGAVRALNRLGWVIETLRAALSTLAVAAPEWLRRHADPAWTDRYAKPADNRILKGDDARLGCAEEIGRDGHALLAAIAAPDAPAWLREVPAAALLWRVWIQNFRLPPVEADFYMPTTGEAFRDLGENYRDQVARKRPTTKLVQRLSNLGYDVMLVLKAAQPSDPSIHSRSSIQGGAVPEVKRMRPPPSASASRSFTRCTSTGSGGLRHRAVRAMHGRERLSFRLDGLRQQPACTAAQNGYQRIFDRIGLANWDDSAIACHGVIGFFGNSGKLSPTPIRRLAHSAITQIRPQLGCGRSESNRHSVTRTGF